ncbi:DUF3619 domain-containing protein [Herminiimonas sp. KBW02]|uniref:DUF3619 family protein n=1 Tax=Herminiimonas sp. KBW02 TaxID=2153363 RepID=UPI000F5A1351|nr:DUF3619 family protein [Herminiimonas sp. KBW02]RQO36167.1 DUF3619 domain-containing protein [Herminiimonas sp. KBW02]
MKTKELDLAYKLSHALDESANKVSANTAERLASARKIALSHKKQTATAPAFVAQPALASHGDADSSSGNRWAWLGRMGMAVPLAALVFGLFAIYQFEQHQQIMDSASIDAEVLTDDLPISAYLDHGFDAFLTKGDK